MTDDETQAASRSGETAGRGLVVPGAMFIVASLVAKGLIMGSPFAEGPLRHWYVSTPLVLAAVALFWAGERLIRRGYDRRAAGEAAATPAGAQRTAAEHL